MFCIFMWSVVTLLYYISIVFKFYNNTKSIISLVNSNTFTDIIIMIIVPGLGMLEHLQVSNISSHSFVIKLQWQYLLFAHNHNDLRTYWDPSQKSNILSFYSLSRLQSSRGKELRPQPWFQLQVNDNHAKPRHGCEQRPPLSQYISLHTCLCILDLKSFRPFASVL